MISRFQIAFLMFLWLMSNMAYAAYSSADVKAVYLFRIINFIHWDNENEMADIQFCALGNTDIAENLITLSQSKTVRRLSVVVTSSLKPECDIVYVNSSEAVDLTSLSPHTLIIGDGEDIGAKGGAIELANVKGKVKPKIYLRNVGSYTISASLLRIAVVEKEGSE